MVEVPHRALDISVDWMEPDSEPNDWDEIEDGKWTSTGSWSITVEGYGEVLRDTQYSNDSGFKTLGEAVTAAEKWATDRRMEITTFGVTIRACGIPLTGNG